MNLFTTLIEWARKGEEVIPEPIVEEVKVPLISEPVLSLIESLENREWNFSVDEKDREFDCTTFIAKNINNSLSFTFSKYTSTWDGDTKYYCLNSWMTEAESFAVATAAFKVIEEECEEWRIANNYKEREKFMILTKEKQ